VASRAAYGGLEGVAQGDPVTCFFDPSHGYGAVNVLWQPQWGVPRPVQTCQGCAQRVQTTPPPYYMPQAAPQAGYPQQGYPQAGYPQPGYPQPRTGHSTAAVVGAGVAGLVGGALIGEMLSDDDRPDYEDRGEFNERYDSGDGDGDFF
jgi:hypothetical protein